ncbi:hypothetical protein ACIPUB_13820 [Paeniglutamicibacter sp. ORCA_105]|uniref:hypothetical protein n=1 Tax=Paeniglutamicibacter sp. ORCA_105 TaxID=3377336 RepID=UPI003895A106
MELHAIGDWIWASLQELSGIAPLGALLAVIVAYFSYRGTVRQKTLADNRNAWWNRAQWAIDAALSYGEQRRATGMAAIEQMQDSELATTADQALLAAMADAVVDETLDILGADDGSRPIVEGASAKTDEKSESGAMGIPPRISGTTPAPASSGGYEITLDSRDGKVVHARSLTQKRILESAERIIAKANKKIAE